jgi:hypothetical protein
MVNTRNNQYNDHPSNTNNSNPISLEQLIVTQNNLMQVVLQTLNNMHPTQQPHQQQAPPLLPPHQSRLVEFLQTCLTTFSHAKDPMEVEDWLEGIEKKLMIAQCTITRKFFLLHNSFMGQ